MTFCKLIAIVRGSRLKGVEKRLVECQAGGLTVTAVKGFGEYANFFSRDWKVRHVRIEIFTSGDRVNDLVEAIQDGAHTGLAGDGLIAVQPVDRVVRIRTGADAGADELHESCASTSET